MTTPAGWYRNDRPTYRTVSEPETCGAEWIIYAAAVTVGVVVAALVWKATR